MRASTFYELSSSYKTQLQRRRFFSRRRMKCVTLLVVYDVIQMSSFNRRPCLDYKRNVANIFNLNATGLSDSMSVTRLFVICFRYRQKEMLLEQ